MSDFTISQGLFLKAIGLVYFFAFSSLLLQVKGLYGARGISPISLACKQIKTFYSNKDRILNFPSLFLWNASDRVIVGCCVAGLVGSIAVMLGLFPSPWLALLWFLYLSFVSVGTPFLNFQWDVLLLETGFLAIFFAVQSPPPPLVVYVWWVLLFRFMFSSGVTKLVYGSSEWRDLTAMDYHYETQPLPTVFGYYAHHQPKWVLKLSVLGVYFIELCVPILYFAPATLRIAGCALTVLLQAMIMLTGNYAFFNILSIFMCLPLLPNSPLEGLAPLSTFSPLVGENTQASFLLNLVAGIFIFLNILELATLFAKRTGVFRILLLFRNIYLINPYGLFVHMTTRRDEIVVEGSEDGEEWQEYTFRWKPQDTHQRPKWVAPHQPRLDWQMWFAALGYFEQNTWLKVFLVRLLEGSDDVLRLLKDNPFPHKPPKYVRALLYNFRFSDLKTKKKTGAWWVRTLKRAYSPVLEIRRPEKG